MSDSGSTLVVLAMVPDVDGHFITEYGEQSSDSLITFESFKLPGSNQRLLGPPHPKHTVIPLALRPSPKILSEITLDRVTTSIESLQQDSILTKKLACHGTLLFRDLPIHNADDFSKFAHAFGYRPHEIISIVVDRPLLAPNVAPANESPKEVLIYSHNESPQVPHAPEYIFYAHRAPSQGGESPISSSLELFNRAQREIPESRNYKVKQQFQGGSTLQQAFGKEFQPGDDEETKCRKVEAQIARYGRGEHTTWEWSIDDDGETQLILSHRLPAIRTQPGTNLPTLFTGLAAYWKSMQVHSGARRAGTHQLFGDGTPIPDEYLAHLTKITDEIRVLHRWEKGDVLVFDNIVAQHGREPWLGEQSDRVVMASLFDGPAVPGPYGFGTWAQLVQATN
ncbi:TauD/TfdA family dioxygenase [Aspergillus saccharolyticus JOP 1030-1]|uniref:Clavaminate synthase-like protein n=1 Tax=Aspergillus saccharolyticus JOP 1030-1 TaxID=1450539 RepID=A0A318ZEK4_9EURO|nr:Clavaminate synthase-like protein [Aspergillus saccharolyticus JOP 1030-1]PYH45976.1 Clavaminate synthase-like protein [Aspergillus saccharolyticus JOP 1030-1]